MHTVVSLHYRMPLPSDLPPSPYELSLAVYSWTTGAPIEFRPLSGGEPVLTLRMPPVVVTN